MVEEIKRTYTIPLRRGYANTPRYKRTNKAVRVLKKYIIKHMKSEKIKIGPHLNDLLWVNGIKNPPSKVHVIAKKDANNIVRVELIGKDYVDFKQKEKVEAPKNLQDKLKKSVEDAKGTKETPKANPAVKKTESKKETTPKVEEKKAESITKEKPVESNKKAE